MKTYNSYYIHECLNDIEEHPTIDLGYTFTYNDYTTGEGVSSELELEHSLIVDRLYDFTNYKILDRRGDNSPSMVLVRQWNSFIDSHANELSAMLSALLTEYNPLENYNKHGNVVDKHTGSDSVSGSNGNTRTLNTIEGNNAVTGNTETFNTTDTTTYDSTHSTADLSYTDTHKTPSTTATHSEGSFDSTTLKAVSSDTTNEVIVTDNFGSKGSTLTNDGSDSSAKTGTIGNQGSENRTITQNGTITDSNTNNSTNTYNSTNTIIDTTHGNIGLTQNTEMLRNELSVRKHSFLDYLVAYFLGTKCFMCEGIEFGDFR